MKMNKNRRMVTGSYRLGTAKALTAVSAIMMIMGRPTSPAVTMASPMTMPPTTLRVCPMASGRRSPASRSSSYSKKRAKASPIAESGVAETEPRKAGSSIRGIRSGWKVTTAT